LDIALKAENGRIIYNNTGPDFSTVEAEGEREREKIGLMHA